MKDGWYKWMVCWWGLLVHSGPVFIHDEPTMNELSCWFSCVPFMICNWQLKFVCCGSFLFSGTKLGLLCKICVVADHLCFLEQNLVCFARFVCVLRIIFVIWNKFWFPLQDIFLCCGSFLFSETMGRYVFSCRLLWWVQTIIIPFGSVERMVVV